MITCKLFYFSFLLCIFQLLFPSTDAHGWMDYPCQRGTLTKRVKYVQDCDFPDAPPDYLKHFPAGDKTPVPGAARRSQMRAGGKWVPFEPMKPDFKWRTGVCGDLPTGPQEHMRGGKFYYDGKVTAEYRQGDVMDVTISFVANHNGFIQLHVCDVAKCDGEISEDCFKQGHCYALKRAPNESCDSGNDLDCGPIDRNYPERWYIPCPKVPYNKNVHERKGGKKMQFLLPKDLTCEHCVLHWFWEGGNNCNAPGLEEYYEGPDGPNWGQCKGQSGAVGGYAKYLKECGGNEFPEEYYQCADIRINPSGKAVEVVTPTEEPSAEGASSEETTSPEETTNPEVKAEETVPTVEDSGDFEAIRIVADDEVIVEAVKDGDEIDVSGYSKIAIEAIKSDDTGPVDFYVDGEKLWTDWRGPFFLYGNRGRKPKYTKDPPMDTMFTLKVTSANGEMTRKFSLVK